MKPLPTLAALCAFILAAAPGSFAQGSLTPPGAPAPSMKSLADLDAKLTALDAKAVPRTPLSQATIDASASGYLSLSTPGHYFLTSNITIPAASIFGIYISSANVTLDLNGYSIITPANHSLWYGPIYIGVQNSDPTIANIRICNGSLIGPKTRTGGANPWEATYTTATFSRGIYAQRAGASWGANAFRLENLVLRGFTHGIDLNLSGNEATGGRATIAHCQVYDCELSGIMTRFTDLSDIVVAGCGGTGVRVDGCNLERVVVERCGGDGISGGSNTIRGAVARYLGGTGFNLSGNTRGADLSASGTARGVYGDSVVLQGVTVSGNRGHGIEVVNSSVTGFQAVSNSGSGLSGNNNALADGNTRSNAAHGIVSPESSVRGVVAYSNTGAGIYCDNSSITGCVAHNNGDDGIRGIGSVISDCRAYTNDTTAGGYVAVGIAWSGGKITNSLADTASPAIP